MPKKKSLWKREFPCLACETPSINYQFMTKSQTIVYDDWMVAHMQPVGEYEEYPDELKTSVCPCCFAASNEYNYGVDNLKYFSRNVRKNEQLKELYNKTVEERFRLLSEEFYRFEKETSLLDKQKNRPSNTRSRATFQKIWAQRDRYGVPFFNLMLQEPRDYVTTLVCYALDRYCQLLRIAYNYDVEPLDWEYKTLADAVEKRFIDTPLGMKAPEPRFYFIGTNFLQSIQFLAELKKHLYPEQHEPHADVENEFWQEAYRFLKLSFANDDVSAIPLELKDGGLNLLMARLHFKFEDMEAGIKCLRFAKNYADNRLKQISSSNQQKFVNDVDDMSKIYLDKKEDEAETKAKV